MVREDREGNVHNNGKCEKCLESESWWRENESDKHGTCYSDSETTESENTDTESDEEDEVEETTDFKRLMFDKLAEDKKIKTFFKGITYDKMHAYLTKDP